MAKAQRDKGLRAEREVVHHLQDGGIGAERVPLSGASGGSYAGDVSFPVKGRDWTGEVKVRAFGFARLYAAMQGFNAILLGGDTPVYVLRLAHFIDLAMRRCLEQSVAYAGPTGLKKIHEWLGTNDALFVRRDRDTWLVVLPVERYQELLK